jgi:hypothetical protein
MSGSWEAAGVVDSPAATAEPRRRGRKNGEGPGNSAGLGEDFRAEVPVEVSGSDSTDSSLFFAFFFSAIA